MEWERIWNIEPILFDERLIELAEESIREVYGNSHRLPSGPLHDAAEVARAGVPTVMLFVQSLRGLSHTKLEDTKEEHLELSVRRSTSSRRRRSSALGARAKQYDDRAVAVDPAHPVFCHQCPRSRRSLPTGKDDQAVVGHGCQPLRRQPVLQPIEPVHSPFDSSSKRAS